jgi:hypothetical protein
MTTYQNKHAVLFRDGTSAMAHVYIYGGACMTGDPTAYVIRNGRWVWVVPGESISFVEA